MTTTSRLLSSLCGVTLVALVSCSDSDVPPGSNSSSILDGRPDDGAATERVDESEVIPEEYTGLGDNAARIATATLLPTEGNTASGLVAFIQPDAADATIRVVARLINVTPGDHGFHVHETGNCTAPDASTAGEHFNPTSAMHGSREGAQRHVGDLGNLTAASDGVATLDFHDSQLSFNGVNSIVGKAFIVHAMPDDLTTQPSGNSGDRIACGVIEMRQGA